MTGSRAVLLISPTRSTDTYPIKSALSTTTFAAGYRVVKSWNGTAWVAVE